MAVRLPAAALGALALATLAACGHTAPAARTGSPPAVSPAAIVAAPDRTEADRALDAGRSPVELLTFLDLRPGMRVAELGAGRGYTTELLARAVGPGGVVYAQNSPAVLGFVGEAWKARLARPVMGNVVRVDREFDSPLPPGALELDAVVINAIYHDTVGMKVDRAAMNRAVYKALQSGGVYLVIDSSARAGSGTADAEALHRIDEALVRDEVLDAGFRLVGGASFLRNPLDARDWNASPAAAGERRGTSDRFVLKFVKP